MKKKYIGILFGIAIATVSGMSHAQLGGFVKSLTGGGGDASNSVTAEGVVNKYVAASKDVMTADIHLLNALGLKEQAEISAQKVKSLTEGATASALEDAAKVQTESSKMLAEKMSGKKVVLDEKGKKTYTQGLIHLAKGAIKYKSLTTDVKNFQPSMASIGNAGNAAVFIVKSLPTSSSNLIDTLKKAVKFAQENKIKIPKDVIGALPD